MALKFLDATGTGRSADAIRALNYAVANGATISNNSSGRRRDADPGCSATPSERGRPPATSSSPAAGNVRRRTTTRPRVYPASYTCRQHRRPSPPPTDNDALASFSNYGATTVDLAAPGVDILSTVPGGQYGTLSGTSMATPHVTGVVALVRGPAPGLDLPAR